MKTNVFCNENIQKEGRDQSHKGDAQLYVRNIKKFDHGDQKRDKKDIHHVPRFKMGK